MAIFSPEAASFPLPVFHKVTQVVPDEKLQVEEIPTVIAQEIGKEAVRSRLQSGKTAAVLVGSRGIDNLALIVRCVIDELKKYGVEPFIVPAMGSHGGGIAENQQELIEGYGITEKAMGVPIRSSMDTIQSAVSESGIPVYADQIACSADYIIPINRIKVHTDFKGYIESGLCKMLVIGLGKHRGCSRVHQEGFQNFPHVIPEVAKAVLGAVPVPFGLGIIENGHDHTHTLAAIPGDQILEQESEYLVLSKKLLPRLNFDRLDVLVVDQIGKNISGSGMDPNITGRVAGRNAGPWEFDAPEVSRIVTNRIAPESHGNAVGMGCADFTTRALFDQINFEFTYANQIASCVPENAFTPVVMPTEEDALRAAIVTSRCPDWSKAKVVRIKDTLHLVDIEVSESLLDYCRSNENFIVPTK